LSMMSASSQQRVEYIPPSDEQLHELVDHASNQLAVQTNDTSYVAPENRYGLYAFIKLVAKVKTKQANAEQECGDFDSLSK
ncbi:MAG: hypothetical protein AAF126_25535, partial [Chloroflexota bacterium]